MTDKLDMKSMDITGDNIAKIKALFPSAVTEVMGDDGKVKLAIDFDALKLELADDIIADKQERYQMTWPDKSKAKVLANSRISATLRPDKEKSVDFDNTENLYIEGDNLDVLKLLRETYLGKVKMIYIDPPYNTGNDFVYEDDFAMSADDYAEVSGQYDEQGNRLVKNLDSNGRFHTDWLNMIYPRLKAARDLLTDDGVIFISIDDREQENLKKVCNEIYGEHNCIGVGQWRRVEGKPGKAVTMARTSEFVLIYSKDFNSFSIGMLPLSEDGLKEFRYSDAKGQFRRGQIYYPNRGIHHYAVTSPYGNVIEGDFTVRKSVFDEYLSKDLIYWAEQGEHTPYLKIYLSEFEGVTPTNTFGKEYGSSQSAVKEFKALFETEKMYFDNPKPLKLLKRLLLIGNLHKDSIVLDFFSGSATTAHAVMQLNAEDGGKRKFIMVQLPENCDEKSDGYKYGFKTICEIGQERIRRAGKKIKEEGGLTTQDLDVGFRVLKLDSSNMQEVYYNPSAMTQDILAMTVDNVKTDRTPLDLLFQVMLDLGVELSAKIDEHTVNGKTYYAVNENDIIACFDDDIDNDVITAIAKQNPLYAVFKDKSFVTDSVGINNEQLFKTYSPSTVVKVI